MSTISISTNSLDSRSIMTYDFKQASVYTDACFILALLDKNDSDHVFAKDILLMLAHSGATLCYSNHVQHEVTHTLLRMYILEALDMYERLGRPTNTTSVLTSQQINVLMDISLIGNIYYEALNFVNRGLRSPLSTLPRNNRRLLKLNVPALIKHLKHQGIDLVPFYKKANDVFDKFISMITLSLQTWYRLNLNCLPSIEVAGLNALQLAKITALDSTDSIHVSVAFTHGCSYFLTKDGDLSSININGVLQHQSLLQSATGTGGGTSLPSPIIGCILHIN